MCAKCPLRKRGECLASYAYALLPGPHVLQTMQEFHVISLDSFTAIGGSDVEGRLAVFGDAAISNYSVSYVVPPPTSTFDIDRSGHATPAILGRISCGMRRYHLGVFFFLEIARLIC
jgi:hypothetical protein